jgi:PA14 domain
MSKVIQKRSLENSGQITLTAGQQYDIRMEYFENGGGAVAKLKWSSPSQPKGIVPQGRLYPQTSGPQVFLVRSSPEQKESGIGCSWCVVSVGSQPR